MSEIPSGHAHPFDSTPHLPAAGIGEGIKGHQRNMGPSEAVMTMQPELFNPEEPCPEQLKKWRKNPAPGMVCLHPGVADDADHQRLDVYGRAEPVGVKVHEIMNSAPSSYIMAQQEKKKESIYLSNKREPLGKPYVRGHTLPQKFQNPLEYTTLGFGNPTPQDVSGDQSKHLLHPEERLIPQSERDLYIKSHANYDPGEQRHRGYSWVDKDGPIEPANYRFGGRSVKGELNGVGKAMNPALDETLTKPSIICDKLLEDFRVVNKEGLGQVKSLGYGRTDVPPNMVYGMASQAGPEWGVRECIGNYTPEEQQPDKDLGRSIRPGWRNIDSTGRGVFGVPSIRRDVAAPSLKSVADHQNYGDEAGAGQLLYPPRFSDGGVTQADFLTATAKAEIADIFRSAGFELSDAQVDETFERAKKLDTHGRVSVQSFRMALNGEV